MKTIKVPRISLERHPSGKQVCFLRVEVEGETMQTYGTGDTVREALNDLILGIRNAVESDKAESLKEYAL